MNLKPANQRLISLDVFRGITIALMILVNSPGNATPYYWLEHSAWNGCTLADLVFPFWGSKRKPQKFLTAQFPPNFRYFQAWRSE